MTYLANRTTSLEKVILLGDTNFWQRKGWFMWNNDKKAYEKITEVLSDSSKNISPTSITSFSPDKVFISSDIRVNHIESPRICGRLMDHYPVVFEI